jgi:hypothetical protein
MLRSALTRFAFVLLLPLCACSQGENQPCQIDGDCDDGLICVRAPRTERGTCENPKTLDQDASTSGGGAGEGPLPDAGAAADAGTEDAGSMASAADAG